MRASHNTALLCIVTAISRKPSTLYGKVILSIQAGKDPILSSYSNAIPYYLPELSQLHQLLEQHAGQVRSQVLATLPHKKEALPLLEVSLGDTNPEHPCLILVGGIHGVERIGSQLILAFLQALLSRQYWDQGLKAQLKQLCILCYPIMNPTGMWHNQRSNHAGVDLMRNAPVNAMGKVPFLVGGHRYSNSLPWFRGRLGSDMELENQILTDRILQQTQQRPFTLLLDCHSGFGFHDRIWFPFAHTATPIEHVAEIYKIKRLFEESYPHYQYIIEPQACQYMTHGDIWDYVYLQRQHHPTPFLPLTLELGSWRWVKKNPKQLLSFTGLFNPIKPHRLQRTLRRHMLLFEFMMNLTRAYQTWLPDDNEKIQLTLAAQRLWYAQAHSAERTI